MSEPTVNVENADTVEVKPQATTTTIEHTDASALPELDWGWRRGFIFVVTSALLLLVWRIVEMVADVITLRMIARYSLILVGLGMMLYIAGASSEGITKLVQAAKTTRKETTTTESK